MYTIGQFSKIGNVSTKMLRYYDKIGLIKPTFVNPENQYRYYEKHQVQDILKINRLKKYKFSLDEIKQIIKDKSNSTLEKFLSKQISLFETEIQQSNDILLHLKHSMDQLQKGEDIMNSKRNFHVLIDTLKDTTVLSIRDTISMDNIGNLIGKVFENIYRNGLSPFGNIRTIYYDQDFDQNSDNDFDHNNADIEVCIPVNRQLKTDTVSTKVLKGGLYVHTTFIGPYSEIGEAYAELLDWINKNSYKIAGPPHDEYIKGPDSKCSHNEFVTEVYFPINKK
ncbi:MULTISPECIES: MerR family transcriptional regulator [Clostridium]|uniref:Multidrug-efflux transporter 1 regulator n=1 Tax=Clostridium ragsdalei P11 TaxID=1353534 RepID=A0A1A6B4B9_9CLOT|nr:MULTISPECIES: MerR family transcriptional regulator [Clostridium]OBR97147.1 multidrug-efflux transporter 1 regulator [Clostridium ragsdalei P11]QXE20895.1 MerR family transcriptional regulator [Clostridium sp. 001]